MFLSVPSIDSLLRLNPSTLHISEILLNSYCEAYLLKDDNEDVGDCGTDVVPIILPENPAEGTDIDVLRSFLEDEPPPLILEHDDDDQPPLDNDDNDDQPPLEDVPRSSLQAERHEAEHQNRGSIHLHMLWTQQDGRYIRNQISGDEKPGQS